MNIECSAKNIVGRSSEYSPEIRFQVRSIQSSTSHPKFKFFLDSSHLNQLPNTRGSFTMAPIKLKLKVSPKKRDAAASAAPEDAPEVAVAHRTRASTRTAATSIPTPPADTPSSTMAPVSQTPHDVVESKFFLSLFLLCMHGCKGARLMKDI